MQTTDNPSTNPRTRIWDEKSLSQLLEAQDNVPRYLFRAWCSVSGGHSGLNCKSKIIPHAFMFDTEVSNLGPDADLSFTAVNSEKDFFAKAREHLAGTPTSDVNSPFSSWTQSFNFALRYAIDMESHKSFVDKGATDAHISMIDTQVLRDTNSIWYVPDLGTADFKRVDLYDGFHWEYLCHGVVDHPTAHRAVSLKTLKEGGLFALYPEYTDNVDYWDTSGLLWDPIKPLTQQEIAATTKLVAPFANLAPAAACALLTTLKRSKDFWDPEVPDSRPDKSVVDQFLNIYGLEGLPDWSTSETIMTDRGLQPTYEATWQFRRLMRAIEERKGAMQAHSPTTPSKPNIPMLPVTPYTTSRIRKFKAAVSEAMSPFLDDDLDVSAPLGVTPVTPEKTPSKVGKAKAAFVDLVSPKKKK